VEFELPRRILDAKPSRSLKQQCVEQLSAIGEFDDPGVQLVTNGQHEGDDLCAVAQGAFKYLAVKAQPTDELEYTVAGAEYPDATVRHAGHAQLQRQGRHCGRRIQDCGPYEAEIGIALDAKNALNAHRRRLRTEERKVRLNGYFNGEGYASHVDTQIYL
jgi:hypothetical protein